MHHTISNIDTTVSLQQYIDNRDGNKRVGLKQFTYILGWFNVFNQSIQKDKERPIYIQDGYYSFQQIADLFQSLDIILFVNEMNGVATLTTKSDLRITKNLKDILGFNKRKLNAGTHNGVKPVDFATHKTVYVHLEQLNSSKNHFNGAPSTILAGVPILNSAFGDVLSIRFENPEYKYLSNGALTELKLSVCDEYDRKIDNHGLPMSAVLEII